ncbi:hypothetical protein [Ileibacterium valens]|uniref:hypothetical protein n=1 Tax=Ileibacterium valens TaxID=1862668 RepID=UPI002732201F|nr:hypothetical protein [Ileibacterium valens]
MESFNFCGKILAPKKPKEGEARKDFSEVKYDSGWVNRTCNFAMSINDQTQYLQAKGGKFSPESKRKNKIYTFYKTADGKSEKKEIPFEKRQDPAVLEKVPAWAKYVIELNKDNKKEYLSAWDFAKAVNSLVTSDKYRDRQFRVSGNVNRSFNSEKDRWYSNFEVKKISFVPENQTADEYAHSTVELFFDQSAMDEIVLAADGEMNTVSAYVQYYDSKEKETMFAPYALTVRKDKSDNQDLADRRFEVIQKKFFKVDDEKVYKMGAIVNIFSGNHKLDIKLEDLDEELRENVELRIITIEEAARSLSEDGNVYGERVQENIFIKPSRGYASGRLEASEFTSSNLRNISDDDENLDDGGVEDIDDDDLFEDADDIDDDDLPF